MDNKLGNFWQLMGDFYFKFDRKLPTDLICVLCKNILIDARISSCGCRFCKKCIEQYLVTGDLICPGNSEECGEEMLNLERDVTIDIVVNRKISKMKVPCPIDACPFVDPMMNMAEHLAVCRSHAVKCPYSEYGCKYATLDAENISSHLNTNKDGHNDMMVVTIGSLKDKCEKLSSDNEVLSNKNNSMIEEAENTKELIDGLRGQLTEKDKKISSMATEMAQVTSKCDSQLKEIDLLKGELKDFYNANVTEFEWQINNYADIKRKETVCCSDDFSIHPNGTKLKLHWRYENGYRTYIIGTKIFGNAYNTTMQCPVTCDITVGIVNPNTGQYLVSKNVLMTFTSFGQSHPASYCTESDLAKNYNTSQKVTVKCIVKIIN